MARLIWDETDDTAHVATGASGTRYVAWPDGALSGYGMTTYHETVAAAKTRAQHVEDRRALANREGSE